ncbi:MAG: hypothetical protein ACR2FY_24590 [Pirellulaceae bacterium]
MLRASVPPSSRLYWRRVFLAPVCLCAVAALHLYRVSACGQTPWKGGGFGMFSTVDSEDNRFLRCRKVEQAKDVAVPVPRYLSREELRLRVAPTSARLTLLAGLMAEHEQAPVVVEVWQYRFDTRTNKLLAQKRSEARGTP